MAKRKTCKQPKDWNNAVVVLGLTALFAEAIAAIGAIGLMCYFIGKVFGH